MAAATLTSLVIALSMTAGCGGDETETGGVCTASPAASLAFGAACCDSTECSTGKCSSFMQKGKRCTKDCAVDADCLMTDGSNLGCGGMLVCKVP